MNIFMLGNGFDLHYSFPTKYINFLNTMEFLCRNADTKFETIDRVFGDLRLQDQDKGISRCYDKYKAYYPYVQIDQTELTGMVAKAKKNSWFNYFCEKYNKDVGWIDFEKEIAGVLERLNAFFSSFDNYIKHGSSVLEEEYDTINGIQDVLRLFSFGHYDTKKDGRKEGEELVWSLGFADHDEYFFFQKKLINPDGFLNKARIISDMLQSLNEFSRLLSFYLRQFVEAPIPWLVAEHKIQKRWLFNDQNAEIITFNYTNTFEQLYMNNTKKVHHIHGVISPNTDIVLGINADKNDELARRSTEFLPFKKYYQRVVFQTDNSYIKLIRGITEYKAAHNNQGEAFHLYVFGHSLNMTDKDALKELFSIADSIDILYHSQGALSDYVENLVTIYGKHKFDQFRVSKRLNFIPDRVLYDEEYATEIGFKQ